MKKMVLLALLFAMLQNVSAQDTIHSLSLKSSYMFEGWPAFDTVSDSLTNLRLNSGACVGYIGFGFEAEKDSLPIYGVAVSTNTYLFEEFIDYDAQGNVDSSDFFSYIVPMIYNRQDSADAYEEYGIGLYDGANHNLYPISEMVPLNIFTKPDYYHAIGCHLYQASTNGGQMKYYPVFELYFDEPVKVVGEFFVMKTNRMRTKAVEMGLTPPKEFYSWPSLLNCVQTIHSTTSTTIYRPFVKCLTTDYPPENNYYYNSLPTNGGRIIYFFPIIEPDTARHVGGDGDSEAVREVNVLQRTVALMPNPASDMVRVVSTSGLSLVEVYDATGVKVAEQKTVGSETVIDTRDWPAGQYVVIVHTPIGIVSKKLSVVR